MEMAQAWRVELAETTSVNDRLEKKTSFFRKVFRFLSFLDFKVFFGF